MKAALVTSYGSPDVIRIAEVPKPVPGPRELLVKVHATSVNRTDCGELVGGIARVAYGLLRPRRQIFGMDFAGVIEDVGPGVTAFSPGERSEERRVGRGCRAWSGMEWLTSRRAKTCR